MNNDVISRREFGMLTGGASMALLAPSQSLAANEGSGAPVNYSRVQRCHGRTIARRVRGDRAPDLQHCSRLSRERVGGWFALPLRHLVS
jgi:hypothetical protein